MNCVASSLAAFIVGIFVGVVPVAVVATAMLRVLWRQKKELSDLVKPVMNAVIDMVTDPRVEEYVSDDAPDDALTEEYGVPTDRWLALVGAVCRSGTVSKKVEERIE